MAFELPYAYSLVESSYLIVDNDGEFSLRVSGESGDVYVIVKTRLGLTTIFSWGPAFEGVEWFPNNYNFTFTRFKFSKTKIKKAIASIINDRKLHVYKVDVITEEAAKKYIRDNLKYYLDNYDRIEDNYIAEMVEK